MCTFLFHRSQDRRKASIRHQYRSSPGEFIQSYILPRSFVCVSCLFLLVYGLLNGVIEGCVPPLRCSITITGEALTHALSSAENRRYFFGLASLCNTVIACRVSPKQKAEVVHHCQRYVVEDRGIGTSCLLFRVFGCLDHTCMHYAAEFLDVSYFQVSEQYSLFGNRRRCK